MEATLASQALRTPPYRRPLGETLSSAIAAHGLWKMRFKLGLKDRHALPEIAIVGAEDQCECGRWLMDGTVPELRGDPAAAEARRLHSEFHRRAARVIELMLEGLEAEAYTQVSPGGEFTRASVALTTHLMRWQRGN